MAVSTSTKSSCARLQAREQPLQRRQVEHVLEALAVGLEDDRERAVLARDLEEALRLQPLLPERRALARPPARDQQRAAGVLAEARAEERGVAQLGHHELLDLVRVDEELLGAGVASASGRWSAIPSSDQSDCTSRPSDSRSRVADRHRPGRMHPAAERRQDADAPVADLVAEALDDDRLVRGDGAGRRLLLAQEGEQVLRRPLVEQ